MHLADLLVGMGHSVCASVATEAMAVSAAVEFKPDLMIVDGNLREGGNGVEAMRRILKTGYVAHFYTTGDKYRLGAPPGAIVVPKPYDVQALMRAIDCSLAASLPP